MNFDDILSATESGARVISEEHDSNAIDIRTERDDIDQSTVTRTRINSGWDAGEYRVSLAEAKRMSETEEGRAELRRRAQQRANLDTSTGKVAMFGVMEPWWHGLGTMLDRAANGEEALRHGQLVGWDLKKIQNQYRFNDEWHDAIGSFSIVRSDTGAALSTRIGDRYTIIHNEELAEFADGVLDYGARFVSGGALGKGEKVWLLAQMPHTAEIADGDEVQSFVLFSNAHDGRGSFYCCTTDERVVCANTYRSAIAAGGRSIRIPHYANAKLKIEAAKDALGLAKRQHEQFVELARELAAVEMPQGVRSRYFDMILDETTERKIAGVDAHTATLTSGKVETAIDRIVEQTEQDAARKQLERLQRRRTAILEDIETRFESDRCNGMPSIAGSAWAALNAVTESLDHSPIWQLNNPESSRDTTNRRESRLQSITEGNVANLTERATTIAGELTQVL